MSNSSIRTRRTRGSAGTSGTAEVAITGWDARTARGGPQYGARISHSSPTASTGPTMDEQRTLRLRALGERADRLRPGGDRDQVGTRVAQRDQPPVAQVAPHLRAEAPRVEPAACTRELTNTLDTGSASRIARASARYRSSRTRTGIEPSMRTATGPWSGAAPARPSALKAPRGQAYAVGSPRTPAGSR